MFSNRETMRTESNDSHRTGAGEQNHDGKLSLHVEAVPEVPGKPVDVSDNEYWNYCDNCGTRLQAFRCRYVCPNCGFFHSCSEP